MTREKAIKAIQDFIGWFKEDSLIRKALDTAIQALSQEPCEKCEVGNPCLYCKHEFSQSDTSTEQELPSVNPQPCDDAISINAVDRFGVLNEIYEWTISGEYEQPRGTDILIKRINNMPTVTQESEYFIDGVHAMGYREGYKDAQKQKSGCENGE